MRHNGSAVRCTINGNAVIDIVSGGKCPIDRWPDYLGTTTWMGIQWIGVPEPLRWRLTWQLGRVPRNLAGCGCIKAVKESRLGPWLEPFLEGIPLLRNRFGEFLTEFHAIR